MPDLEELRRGTFAPFSRASLSPIAIACFRLFTVRPEPLLSVPFFLRCIADSTRLLAALPYLAMRFADAKAVLTVHDQLMASTQCHVRFQKPTVTLTPAPEADTRGAIEIDEFGAG